MYRIALEDPKWPLQLSLPTSPSRHFSKIVFTGFQTHQACLLVAFPLNRPPILSADTNPIWLPKIPRIPPFLRDSHRTGREADFGASQITPQSWLSTLFVGLHRISLSRMT